MVDPITAFGYVGYVSAWVFLVYATVCRILDRRATEWTPVAAVLAGIMTVLGWLTLFVVVGEKFCMETLVTSIVLYLALVTVSLLTVEVTVE